MRILFLTENFPPEMNAAATRVFERALYWVAWGHEVTVVTCSPNFPMGALYPGYKNRLYQVEVMQGIRVVRVKTFISENKGVIARTLDFLSFMVTGFMGGLVQTRPDVVVSTSPQFFTAVAAWGVSFFRRVPYVFELGDLWPGNVVDLGVMKRNPAIISLEWIELFMYRQSRAVVALTRSFKENLTGRGIPANKIAVVINGVDLPRYAPRKRDEVLEADWNLTGKFVIGYIGTHGMAHALENVLRAADLLRDEPQIRFMFVGAGATREGLITEAERLGLQNVVFVPPQPKECMPRFWSLCDVALIHLRDVPVFKTVIPSKMFEAMGMGLAQILASPEGEAKAILDEAGAGAWVAPEDPQELARIAREMCHDRPRVQLMAQNSLASAPRYSRERQARDMIAVLESAAANEPQVPERTR